MGGSPSLDENVPVPCPTELPQSLSILDVKKKVHGFVADFPTENAADSVNQQSGALSHKRV